MKTHDLVAVLSSEVAATAVAASGRLFAQCLVLSAVLSLGLMLLVLGPQPDLAELGRLPMFWLKLAIPLSVAGASFVALQRLGHPGRTLGAWGFLSLLPLLALWAGAAVILTLAASHTGRWTLALDSTWPVCVASIALLSVPGFVLAIRALRAMAPTRLILAGAVAGLFAGSLGAFAYALHCPEMKLSVLAVWYELGMLAPAAAGALLGPRLLRW